MVPLRQTTTMTIPLIKPSHRWMSLKNFRVFCQLDFSFMGFALREVCGSNEEAGSEYHYQQCYRYMLVRLLVPPYFCFRNQVVSLFGCFCIVGHPFCLRIHHA